MTTTTEDNICAPGRFDRKNKTCFSTDQLMEMAKAYNSHINKNKINAEPILIMNNKSYLLEKFKEKFNQICNGNEVCLTEQQFMNKIVKEMRYIDGDTFRFMGPKDPNGWLSTTDINNILGQYEKLYKNFKFLGAVPLDCNQLDFCSLYNLNFEEYSRQGIDYLGVIFNLDKYGEPGSHWVTLFIDMRLGEIFFSDSTGKMPRENIKHLIDRFLSYYQNKTGQKATYMYNITPYQTDNSECGVYSCNFIIRKLKGETFESIVNNALTFKQINSCRNVYFRNKPSPYKIHPLCDP